MLEWGGVKAGDTIVAKGWDNEGTLLANGNVEVSGEEISMQKWLKELFGWSSIQTFVFAVHKDWQDTFSECGKSIWRRSKIAKFNLWFWCRGIRITTPTNCVALVELFNVLS